MAVRNHKRLGKAPKIAIVVVSPVVWVSLYAPFSGLFTSHISNGLGICFEEILKV